MTFQEFITRFENAKPTNNGYKVRCPNHDDQRNSLSICEREGKILLNCFAGCSFLAILSKLGIERKDLFTSSTDQALGRIEAIYPYTDETGNLLYDNVRFSPKDFRFRHWVNGESRWGLNGVEKVPYNLPNLVANAQLDSLEYFVFVEGEKDSDTLTEMGFVASSFKNWKSEFNRFLNGKAVVIIQDHDKSGVRQATKAAQLLMRACRWVKIVDPFEELPLADNNGHDISDWFGNGNSGEELRQLIDLTSFFCSEEMPNRVESSIRAATFNLKTLNELLEEPEEEISYIWDETLPTAGLSVCTAKPKVGKSTLARNLAIAVTKGETFLGREVTRGRVIYLCLEEKRAEVIKHFRSMGADGSDILIHTGASPENFMIELEHVIREYRAILVIIDPLSRVLRVPDFNDYAGMTRALEPFVDLARLTECHVMIVHHDGKLERHGGDAVLGSTAIFGSVDCHLQLKKRESCRTISSTQRYGTDFPETIIELDKETGIITSKCDLQTAVLEETMELIYADFGDLEELTEAEIKERNGTKGLTSKAIRALFNAGRLFRHGKGRRNDPYTYRKTSRIADDAEIEFLDTAIIEKSRNPENQENEDPLFQLE